ncbi:unnamed protein product [Durusdinium trenchii]|uniref:Uncharacterized protein n=2 Tax=Durusdinium trenchii TaxID=1381693 RepID=A0ABP0NBF0_9DINO
MTMPPGRRRGLVASCLSLMVAWGLVAQWTAFLEVPQQQELQRRQILAISAGAAAQALPTPAALAGDRDRLSMVLAVRRKFLPKILKTYKELQAAGSITDDFLEEKKLKKFITALMSYGSIQRMEEAPDKISRKLQADAKEVEQFLLAKDYANAMKALETYRLDVPNGGGEFEWSAEG